MNLADISIKRPIFITCIVLVMLALGWLSMKRLGVDLFPDVTFPVVTVTTNYPGAGPTEIETLVTKPLEDELSTLGGIKRLSSVNKEGTSQVIVEFTLETDVKYAEQQVRDHVGSAKHNLPTDVKEPVIQRIDPSDQPILTLALDADLPPEKLFDLADDGIKPKLEQVGQVGVVDIQGGRKREIHVSLDRAKLKAHEISATQVVQKLQAAGENVPAGKKESGEKETVFRTLGEFKSLQDIERTIVNFFGSDVPTTIGELGRVEDSLVDETSRAYINGNKSLFINVFRQSGANTIAVVDAVKARVAKINAEIAGLQGHPKMTVVRDSSVWIHANVEDVQESISIGVILAVIVVFFFLGNGRSTIITGLALPNSLIGSFILMAAAGFTINIMTLLALSLSVGLLVDDAIVVRENIFRHIEMGKDPITAAKEGSDEVRLAVIATTMTVIAVFGPVGFLKGVVGQFFKQFGLTICFAMAISLFDALTIAPMLSAYFAGVHGERNYNSIWGMTVGRMLRGFDRFQDWVQAGYLSLLRVVLAHPFKSLLASFGVFIVCCLAVAHVPATFLPPQDAGEFAVSLDMPPGTNLGAMSDVARKIDAEIRKNKEVEISALTVGSRTGDPNYADFYVKLVSAKDRKLNTSDVKQKLRDQLKPYAYANPIVKDYDAVGGGQRPFILNIIGNDEEALEKFGTQVYAKLKDNPGLKDVDTTVRPGKPEFQIALDPPRARALGISTGMMGSELRTQIEGTTGAKFRESGREYDVVVRLEEDQRNLKEGYAKTFIPNVNSNLIRLSDVAFGKDTTGPATINRQDRGRYVSITADITPGAGMGNVMSEIDQMFASGALKIPDGMRYVFIGQAENFQELTESITIAMGLGVLFIFLVLSSLYESFITPLTIMLALPLAICGSFVALFVTHESMNIFSMIGIIMLLGVATKNSILLVDYANQRIRDGMDRTQALMEAGRTRLRPILMTTMALIAGTVPIALGLNEASRQRTSMGIAIVGGLISSTLLTLIVVPAAFAYIDRFRIWSKAIISRLFAPKSPTHAGAKAHGSPENGHAVKKPAQHAPDLSLE
jgi:HAE1 family hydrophobic/amphiphilic exporter-1